jgi:RecG-like helicase
MVTALRDTSLRPSPSRHLKSNITPKFQAINLLVAEFLLQQNHHFTLSVFTSEAPLLRSMPEFTITGTQVSNQSNTAGESMPRFQQQDVKDIMEILELPLDTELGNRIYCQYQDNSDNTALLTCILQNARLCLDDRSHTGEKNMFSGPTQNRKSSKKFKDVESLNRESSSAKQLAEVYSAEMQEILYQSHLKSLHIKQLQEELRRYDNYLIWLRSISFF